MKFLHHASFKSLKNRRVRASSQAVLGSVATIPDSGLAVVNNSQGASAALHEFSAAIDSILEHLDFEGISCHQVYVNFADQGPA